MRGLDDTEKWRGVTQFLLRFERTSRIQLPDAHCVRDQYVVRLKRTVVTGFTFDLSAAWPADLDPRLRTTLKMVTTEIEFGKNTEADMICAYVDPNSDCELLRRLEP